MCSECSKTYIIYPYFIFNVAPSAGVLGNVVVSKKCIVQDVVDCFSRSMFLVLGFCSRRFCILRPQSSGIGLTCAWFSGGERIRGCGFLRGSMET